MQHWIRTEHVMFNVTGESLRPCPGTVLCRRCWWVGTVLIAVHVVLLLLSSQFDTVRPLRDRPVLVLAGLEMFGGLVWLVAVWLPRRSGGTKAEMLCVVSVGLALRGIMLVSTPMLEDDFWRYLWDGAVVAHGHNPYAHAPQEWLTEAGVPDNQSPLQPLAREGKAVLDHINHPSLRTIYPPLAEVVFAAAYFVDPWSLVALRVVLLMFDAATFVLILCLLRELGLPAIGAAIYWWNPLLIKESVNAAHMDVLVLPFVMGALLLAFRGKPVWATALMSLAAGVKLWPVILLPFLLRPLVSTPRRLALAITVAAGALAVAAWPVVRGALGPASGFAAYAEYWEMNDALFMGLLYGVRIVLGWLGSTPLAPTMGRILALVLLAGWIAWLIRRPIFSAADMAERMLLAVAGLFLLSPTQFPWYGLWMLPLLTLRPRLSLLLLMVLLPLFRLRFYFAARGNVTTFDNGIVWLEYLPVWGLLIWETIQRRRFGPRAPEDASPVRKEAYST